MDCSRNTTIEIVDFPQEILLEILYPLSHKDILNFL